MWIIHLIRISLPFFSPPWQYGVKDFTVRKTGGHKPFFTPGKGLWVLLAEAIVD